MGRSDDPFTADVRERLVTLSARLARLQERQARLTDEVARQQNIVASLEARLRALGRDESERWTPDADDAG